MPRELCFLTPIKGAVLPKPGHWFRVTDGRFIYAKECEMSGLEPLGLRLQAPMPKWPDPSGGDMSAPAFLCDFPAERVCVTRDEVLRYAATTAGKTTDIAHEKQSHHHPAPGRLCGRA